MDHSDIDRFFETYIEGWMLKDLRYCSRVKDENLSFVVATGVFTAVDFLASLWAPKHTKRERFEGFLRTFFKTEYADKNLYDLYRSGLVHQYFPKQGSAVCWNIPEKHLKEEQGRLCVNAQNLVSDLTEAIAEYRKKLRSDKTLQTNFETRVHELGLNLTSVYATNVISSTSSGSSTVGSAVIGPIGKPPRK